MANLNLAKNNKKTKGGARGASGIPNWVLTTIISVVVGAMLLGACWMAVESFGVIGRVMIAAKTENYKISQNMMRYFMANTYQNYMSNNSKLSVAEVYQSKYPGDFSALSAIKVLESDVQNDSKKKLAGDDVGKTWFEFFAEETKTGIKTTLAYCEAADEYGVELTEKDKEDIELSIDSSVSTIMMYTGLTSENSVFDYLYGKGVKREDVRKAMEYSVIAAKTTEEIAKKVEAKVTDDIAKEEYGKNENEYKRFDYFTYSVAISKSEVETLICGKNATNITEEQKKEIEKKLVELQKKVKEDAEKLKECDGIEALKLAAYEVEFDLSYDIEYKKLGIETKYEPGTDDDTRKANYDKIKAIMKADLLAEIVAKNDKGEYKLTETTSSGFISSSTKTEDGKTVYYISEYESQGIENITGERIQIEEKYQSSIISLKKSLFNSLVYIRDDSHVEKGGYVEDSELSAWAFASDRKEGDKTIIRYPAEKDDDGKAVEITKDTASVSYSIYVMEKIPYKDVDVSKDLGYMGFQSKEDAQKALDALNALKKEGKLTEEKFEELVESNAYDAELNNLYKNYMDGYLGSDVVDEWLEKAEKGALEIVELEKDKSYLVCYYIDDGDEYWMANAKNTKHQEYMEEEEDKLVAECEKQIKFDKIVINGMG